jgi:integrase
MKVKGSNGRFSSSSLKTVSSCKSVDKKNLIPNVDTYKKPTLHDYKGELKKRWFIAYFIGQTKKREWIPSRPSETRPARAKELLRIIELRVLSGNNTDIFERLDIIIERLELRKRTKDTYRTSIRLFSKHFDGRNLTSIKEKDAFDFISSLKLKYAGTTVKNNISHLKAVLRHTNCKAFDNLVSTYNIQESEFNTPFSDYEREILENHLKANSLGLFLFTRFIFYGYIRPAELRKLKVSDIDLNTRTIKISGAIAKTRRTAAVPILKPLLDLIIEHKLTRHAGDVYLFGAGLVPNKKMAAANEATNKHNKACKEIGIYRERKTVLYSWKHTGNIQAFLAGMDIRLIQMINRHKSIQTTEIYLRKLGLFLDRTVFDFSY